MNLKSLNNKRYKVTIYTDGASLGNPGPGGYGIVMLAGKGRKEIAKGYRLTTNNRMELLSTIVALESLKTNNCSVTIYSDSKYVVDAIENGWVFAWEQKRFNNKKNPDLWIRFLKVFRKISEVKFIWVKGHDGNPGNERCDILATEVSLKKNLGVDHYYEENYQNDNKMF